MRKSTGTMRERKPGAWELSVSTGEVDSRGRYRRVSRTFHGTEDKATRALARLVVEVEDGKHPARTVTGRTMTVADMLADWQRRRRTEWAPKTVHDVAAEVERLILPRLGNVIASRATPAEIERALADIAHHGRKNGKPVAASTVRRVRSHLGAAFRDAVRLGELERSPMDRVRAPKVPQSTRQTAHTVGDLRAALEHEGPDWLLVLIRVALVTGARRGELVALRWSDIDLDAGTVRFARAISAPGGGPVIEKALKTGGMKVVRIDADTTAMLRAWRVTCAETHLAVGHRLSDRWRVWPSSEDGDTPVHPDRVTKRWSAHAKACGLTGVRFHDLRHATATTMIAAGVDPRTVADHLGHSNPSVTLGIYSGAVPATQQAAVDMIGDALR